MNRRLLGLVIVFSFITALTILLGSTGMISPSSTIKPLGLFYIEETFFGNMTAESPEAVTAIVWDYRGLDTIYETTVFFLAVVAGIAVFRVSRTPGSRRGIGLTDISRTSTKIVFTIITVVSASIALHGHLTPGGGFQGGSTLAVAPLLVIPVFSYYALLSRKITPSLLVGLRGLALTSIALVAMLPVIRGLEIVTNVRFYPAYILGQLVSGSLIYYNSFEYIAVGTGFVAIFLYLSYEEEFYKTEMGGEGYE
ncbi:MnhB domain-containing protein [Thermogladius sp. 4427co]|uniref:MnhB domain-containing protein n=1 Tax=Thermogladius sp. 4427co TaxID=3450718 RepID=UPI003F7A0952